jgi:hypothetical protein
MVSGIKHGNFMMEHCLYVATVHRLDPVLSHIVSWFLRINDFIVATQLCTTFNSILNSDRGQPFSIL